MRALRRKWGRSERDKLAEVLGMWILRLEGGFGSRSWSRPRREGCPRTVLMKHFQLTPSAGALCQRNLPFSFRLTQRFPSRSSLLSFFATSLVASEVSSPDPLADLKWANLSVSFGARRIAGNDIGTGPVLITGGSSVPNVVSRVVEVIASVCKRDSKRLR